MHVQVHDLCGSYATSTVYAYTLQSVRGFDTVLVYIYVQCTMSSQFNLKPYWFIYMQYTYMVLNGGTLLYLNIQFYIGLPARICDAVDALVSS